MAAFTALSPFPAGAQTSGEPGTGQPAHTVTNTMPAQDDPPLSDRDIQYMNGVYLAYVTSSSPQVNQETAHGLEVLSGYLTEKTSIEPDGVAALNIEQDNLAPFSFIYWPVTREARALSDQARQKVQKYIDRGGMILFDVRDRSTTLEDSKALSRLLDGLHMKPWAPLKDGHSLTKSFYLISDLKGSLNYDRVWVESPAAIRSNSVSSVIIGNRNWAGAWAGQTLIADSEDHKKALWAGVNMMSYALTGNYKNDQQHQKAIEQRRNNR